MKQACGFVLWCLLLCVVADEEWGYVAVRPGANMFWWFYSASGNWQSKPLVMWLQVQLIFQCALKTKLLH